MGILNIGSARSECGAVLVDLTHKYQKTPGRTTLVIWHKNAHVAYTRIDLLSHEKALSPRKTPCSRFEQRVHGFNIKLMDAFHGEKHKAKRKSYTTIGRRK